MGQTIPAWPHDPEPRERTLLRGSSIRPITSANNLPAITGADEG